MGRWTGRCLAAVIAAFLGCTSRVPEGTNCQFNDDCIEPLICAGRICRAQCRSDRDCPSNHRCTASDMLGKRVCLPPAAAVLCLVDPDCPSGAVCAQGFVCRWRCTNSIECAARNTSSRCENQLCSVPVLVSELPPDSGDGGTPPDVAVDVVMAPDAAMDVVMAPDAAMDVVMAPDAAMDVVMASELGSTDALPGPSDVVSVVDLPSVIDVPVTDAGIPPEDLVTFDATRDLGPEVCFPREEVCNGLDDDCDNMVDEDADRTCSLPNAMSECRAGRCEVTSCIANYGDCDPSVEGCETDLRSTAAHCTACFRSCRGGVNATRMACMMSTCSIAECSAGFGDCNRSITDGCEVETRTNPLHCGACGASCPSLANATPACVDGRCANACATGFGDCDGVHMNGCETDLGFSPTDCGACGNTCAVGLACVSGRCVTTRWVGAAMGDLSVTTGTMTLPGGVYRYRNVTVASGATLRSANGILEIYAQGPIVVDGTIDLSGGTGGAAGAPLAGACPAGGQGGGTGTATNGAAGDRSGACPTASTGGDGNPGGNAGTIMGSPTGCGAGGRFGGGGGGSPGQGGGGGGGVAGGGGGGGGANSGAAGASLPDAGTGGAAVGRSGLGIGGQSDLTSATYRGANAPAITGCCGSAAGGGGGGSIGVAATLDLPVAMTFRPGSGGGGGGGMIQGTMCTTTASRPSGGGGGGGGGALRLASAARIQVRGRLLARGGAGGTVAETGCDGGGSGGGGSGGVIYLAAPEVRVEGGAEVNAAGGAGGRPVGSCYVSGGAGGLGRARVAVFSGRCTLQGVWTPALPAGTCPTTPGAGTAGRAYIGTFPEP